MTKTIVDLETLSIDQMLDLKDTLDEKLTALAKTETSAMASRLERLQAYLTDEERAAPATKPSAKPKASQKKAPSKSAPKPKKKAGGKRGKAPIKFRDPASGKAWSGRGITPVWLREYEAAGRSRDEFSI